jgi:hypothetical protein
MQDAMLGPGSTETKKPDMAPIVVEFIFNFALMPKFRNDFFFFCSIFNPYRRNAFLWG